MRIKKKLILILTLFSPFINSCGYDPDRDNPTIIRKGEECTITVHDSDHNALSVYVYYNDYDWTFYDEQHTEILITETITLIPKSSIKLTTEDFLVRVGYSVIEFESSIEENIAKNNYDIFENEIRSATKYTFCFIVPSEYNGKKFTDISFTMKVLHSYRFCPDL